MATLARQQIRATGTEVTFAAASAGGDKIPPGDVALWVKNGDAADKTVTITTPNTVQGQAIGDVAVVVTAGEERLIGPFPAKDFQGTDGLVAVTYSAVTSVTVACIAI